MEARIFSNPIWIMLFLFPMFLPTTNGILHYSVAILIGLFIALFYPLAIKLVISILSLCAYVFLFIINGSDISSVRYVAFLILIALLCKAPVASLSNANVILIVVSICWVIFELLFPNSGLRLLYRSSLQEFHIQRASGLFGFPGDLGHFAVTLFTYFVILRPEITFNNLLFKVKSKTAIWVLCSLACLFLLLVSQSRLAFIQLGITLILIALRESFLSVILFTTVLLCFVLLTTDLSYLLATDYMAIYEALLNPNVQNSYKRVSDLGLILSGQAGLLPTPLPDNVEFVESGFVSQCFRLGGLLAFFVIILIGIQGLIGYLKANRKSLLLACSIITLALLVTNFVGAPFERPKLMFYSAIYVSFLFNLSFKKNYEKRL